MIDHLEPLGENRPGGVWLTLDSIPPDQNGGRWGHVYGVKGEECPDCGVDLWRTVSGIKGGKTPWCCSGPKAGGHYWLPRRKD